MFNDSSVRPSSFESFTSITKTFPTDVAYILFYVRTDVGENSDQNPNLPLPAHLMGEVAADNKKFLAELEAQQRKQQQQQYINTTRTNYDYKDDDKGFGDGSGNGFGGGGGGGFDGGFGGGLGGGRYIF